jgi:hypothetical protein
MQWEGEVGNGRRSGIPHLMLPSPPLGAERWKWAAAISGNAEIGYSDPAAR